MKKTGLYFGTFNPIHVGHLIVANFMSDHDDLDEVWLVVSPQNPLKKGRGLLRDLDRLKIARVAVMDNPKLKICDIEFDLPRPSYTFHTLDQLSVKHPNREFALIMGEDNLRGFESWKNYESILNRHSIFVYPRVLTVQEELEMNYLPVEDEKFRNHKNVHIVDAPVMKVSSTYIRKCIGEGKDVRYLLTDPVYKFVIGSGFYGTTNSRDI